MKFHICVIHAASVFLSNNSFSFIFMRATDTMMKQLKSLNVLFKDVTFALIHGPIVGFTFFESIVPMKSQISRMGTLVKFVKKLSTVQLLSSIM